MDIVDVARASGLSSMTVSRIENGRQIPIVVTVRALSSVLSSQFGFWGAMSAVREYAGTLHRESTPI